MLVDLAMKPTTTTPDWATISPPEGFLAPKLLPTLNYEGPPHSHTRFVPTPSGCLHTSPLTVVSKEV